MSVCRHERTGGKTGKRPAHTQRLSAPVHGTGQRAVMPSDCCAGRCVPVFVCGRRAVVSAAHSPAAKPPAGCRGMLLLLLITVYSVPARQPPPPPSVLLASWLLNQPFCEEFVPLLLLLSLSAAFIARVLCSWRAEAPAEGRLLLVAVLTCGLLVMSFAGAATAPCRRRASFSPPQLSQGCLGDCAAPWRKWSALTCACE